MTHEELRDLYELYVWGALEGEERDEIAAHLARSCPECEAGIRRAHALNASFAGLAENVEPPRRLRQRVLATVGVEGASGSRFWGQAWAFAAAALAVALVIVFINGHQTTHELADAREQIVRSRSEVVQARTEATRSTEELRRLDSALAVLNLPNTRQVVFGSGQQTQPPSGRIFVNPQQGVVLIASHLSPLPSAQTYEMWLIPKGGKPVPAGLFRSDAQGNALYIRRGAVDPGTAAVAVSVEPAGGSSSPTTKPLIVATV